MMLNNLLAGSALLITLASTPAKHNNKICVRPPQTQFFAEGENPLIGRWDITLDKGNGKTAPSWMEVKLSGISTLVGYWVADGGSARPVSEVKFDNGKFSFTIPPQWDRPGENLQVEGTLSNDKISGTVKIGADKTYSFAGVKAPYLKRSGTPVWGKSVKLFNGKDLTGWKATGTNQWEVVKGILTSPKPGSNLVTTQKFTDFKLHVEFRYPEEGNSGVYLRGRYEVQIEDSPKDKHPGSVFFSGVYGFLTPSEINTNGPGQWNSYDITLIGRMVTVVANGKTVISNQEIPGITGGALDSNEGEPGPIYLQGDHKAIEYRSIVITPAK